VSINIMRIPVLDAHRVWLRLSPLPRQGEFLSDRWRHELLTSTPGDWWQIALTTLGLSDGSYEYEFVIERHGQPPRTVADPYAEELTKLSGYRGVVHIHSGQRVRLPFSWDGELPDSGKLPTNNKLVIYELPMRWVDAGPEAIDRQVGLGTFDKALFEHLQDGQSLAALGVNCIELLPIQDSPDTLNWGYGTRFFFAPDFDMGTPFELKLFVKRCHQRGIRVLVDLVMNHARQCPLRDLAFRRFFLSDPREEPDPNGDGRPGWGGDIFRYRLPIDEVHHARAFHFNVTEFLIREYRIDGFLLDEFKGIDSYEFVQDFAEHGHRVHADTFPGRPFIVIAEDSWRRTAITWPTFRGRRVVDAMWDFDFRDDLRRLVANRLETRWGEPSRLSGSRRHRAAHVVGARASGSCDAHDLTAAPIDLNDDGFEQTGRLTWQPAAKGHAPDGARARSCSFSVHAVRLK
jgi:1,4-alpha-glucan branching enzyme